MVKHNQAWSPSGWVTVSCWALCANCGSFCPESKFCADFIPYKSPSGETIGQGSPDCISMQKCGGGGGGAGGGFFLTCKDLGRMFNHPLPACTFFSFFCFFVFLLSKD